MPPLRERGRDVLLIANEFLAKLCVSEQTTACRLSSAAEECLLNYPFPGNIRELRAVIERAAILADSEAIQPEDLSLEPAKAAASLPEEELTLKEYNDRLILNYLQRYDGDVMKVARKLDIGKSTIYRLLKAREAGDHAA